MKTSELDGNKFIELGRMFINLSDDNHMDSNNLDFELSHVDYDNVEPLNHCSTVACHGGWGSVLLIGEEEYGFPSFDAGAVAIAEFLGFESDPGRERDADDVFLYWADRRPDMWGNDQGLSMFSCDGYRAFGFMAGESISIKDIGKHYLKVGERINNYNEGE